MPPLKRRAPVSKAAGSPWWRRKCRSLAQRSAAAAKEIKALIDDSAGKVGSGTQLVGQAGRTMQEIVGSVQRVSDIMGEIAAASDEQTRGIEQVNKAIIEMDRVTQQNAALVEEASAAAQSMQDQSGELLEAVSVFRLGERATPPPTVRPQRPAHAARPATQSKLLMGCEPAASLASAQG